MTWLIACGGFHIGPLNIPHGVLEAIPAYLFAGAGFCAAIALRLRHVLRKEG